MSYTLFLYIIVHMTRASHESMV